MKPFIISVDGPAASGKGKIAKYISKKWKLKHLDSGMLYRRLAYILIRDNVNTKNPKEIQVKLNKLNGISFRNNKYLRSQAVSKASSQIAVHSIVRLFINRVQNSFVNENLEYNRFVIDGRDIGSVVFKNANIKLYIDVEPKIRAKRRYKQLIDSGEKSIYQKILKDIILRDKKDITRKNSPLVIPKGSVVINNNGNFTKTIKQLKYYLDN